MSKGVAVVVLGDIGRSPRMQYHSLSIARLDGIDRVSVVGYNESEPHQQIKDQSNIVICPLKPFPALPKAIPMLLWPLFAIFKILFQILQLFWVLMTIPKPLNYIIVQSPPAIPTTFVLQIVCYIRSIKLIIDWHNIGYTILQLSIHKPKNHIIIRIAKLVERLFGKYAYAHLFVTEAMKNKLVKKWGLKGETYVIHDRPQSIFKTLKENDRRQYLTTTFKSKYCTDKDPELTLWIDKAINRKVSLAISSTSWTPDEDFKVLLDSLVEYDKFKKEDKSTTLPDLLFLITGKGPQKQMYIDMIATLDLKHVLIKTIWLDSEDYPKVVGCADFGVSLHQSSSGVDLPMKVVDMFGCGVPALSRNFKCIGELVIDGSNGRLFETSHQLTELFKELLSTYPKQQTLDRYRSYINANRSSWDEEWVKIKPLFINNDVSKSKLKSN